MIDYINLICIEGRMGNQPDLKYNSRGEKQVFFYVVNKFNRSFSDVPSFIPCLAFGTKAVLIAKYIQKGDLFSIEGYIKRYSKGESYFQYVIVEEVHFITRSSKNFFEHGRIKGGKPNIVNRDLYFKKRF